MALLFVTTRGQATSAHFARLSVQDGLSQSSVESIAEDRYGFLWLGTQEGLNRFDGYEFEVYQQSPAPGRLRDGFIRAITPDSRGDLWIGTSTGLQHLDVTTGRFSESVTPPGIGVRLNTLRVAADGRLWFAGLRGRLWTRAPGKVAQTHPVDAVGGAVVTAVALGEGSNLWVAAGGQLFAVRTGGSGGMLDVEAKVVLRDVGLVRVIHVEGGALWLGRQGAPPLRFDPQSGAVTEYPELARFVLTIASAGDGGKLWIGGRGAGVTRFDPRTRETITYRHEPGNEESLAEDDVAAVHQDSGGSLWVGAWNGGLSQLNLYSQPFRTLRSTPGRPESLPDNDVTRLAEGPDGRLWCMTRNEVLVVGDPKNDSFTTIPFEGDLTAIAFAGPRLFAGTTTGLVELDGATGRRLAPSRAVRAAGLDRIRIEALAGGDDHIWIVTRGALYRLTNGGDAVMQSVMLPSIEELTLVHAPARGRLWLAWADGDLLRADLENGALTVRRIGDAEIKSRGRLNVVMEDRGIVWIGTALGAGWLAPSGGPIEWIDVGESPSRSVASILADEAGVLWIAGERGITRYDPTTARAVQFGAAHGVQGTGYVDGGAARGRDGTFYLAGRGITAFDPRLVTDNPHRPPVVLTSLEVLHREVVPSWIDPDSPLRTGIHAAREVTLGPSAVVFSVEMAAPGVSDPQGVRFAHRLDGFDTEWIETSADRRTATYTRLAPGSYLFRVRARTQSGVWSAEETTLQIRILPPWWRTPAAIALWIALALVVLAAIVHEARRRTRIRIALAEQEVLRRASVTDPLTGLYNRRYLATWLKHEIPQTLRTHHPEAGSDQHLEYLLLVAADLDNLKEINDAFGHDAGDRAIRAVADLLQSNARAGDVAVRLGGDEFVLVLRSAGRQHAGQIVERLRAGAAGLDLGFNASTRPTISLGFASFPFIDHDVTGLTWEQTLQLADRALLHSKRRGRNSWTGFEATPAASTDAVLREVSAGIERQGSAMIRIIEGP